MNLVSSEMCVHYSKVYCTPDPATAKILEVKDNEA